MIIPPMFHRFIRILPWLLTVLIFAFILYRVPLGDIQAALGQVPIMGFLALMLPFSLFYCVIDAFILYRAINWFHLPVRYGHILPARAAAYILTLLNAGLGQGGVTYALHRREGIPLLEMAGTMMFLTVIEVLQLALFAGTGIFVLHPELRSAFIPIYLAMGVGVGGGLLCLRKGIDPIAYGQTFLVRLYSRDPTYRATSLLQSRGLLQTFRQAHVVHYFKTIALKTPLLATAIILHYVALQLFAVHVPLLHLAAFLPVIFLVASLPITVAHLGAPQAAWLYFFAEFGEPSLILVYSLTAHATFMLLNGLIGVCFLPQALKMKSA